jgi:GH24 family phage-related lysozyme (muramidase)
MRMSPRARQKLRDTETVQYRYYNDMGKNKGHCTWGVGILAHRGVCSEEELGKEVSKAEVEAEFSRKVREAESGVHRNIRVELNQAQFDALVSFTYNTGATGAADTYALINDGDFPGAAANMQQFVRVQIKTKKGWKKVVAAGLVKRRAEETAPFLDSRKSQ